MPTIKISMIYKDIFESKKKSIYMFTVLFTQNGSYSTFFTT